MVRPRLDPADRVVVKVGTTSLVDSSGVIDEARVTDICDQIAELRGTGVDVIMVSSGAIAAGLEPLGLTKRPSDIPSLQAAAAVGQGRLLGRYARRFKELGWVTAQMLLTQHDFMHRQQYLNARHTLDRLLSLHAIPVVNENDTVATDEIRFGDNDRLAALVGNLARARLLVLLTDAQGVHARDPRKAPDAPLLDEVERITPELERAAGGRGSELATGGMASKLSAAWVATFSGVGVVVASAVEPDVLKRVAAGDKVGTYFHPQPHRASARRLWIAFAQPPKGTIVVDDGAKRAVIDDKRSLLPVGVVDVKGEFSSGDIVDVAGANGGPFARGLVRYDSKELEAARGRSTAELAGRE
ncbi:MAG TPA: glutamate 5-kinase, partial [Actinomycetota bacterium]|nr:glutamate 5-kinase [Actinomycetota bacterium]